ncbi:hypothetical protein CKAH01_01552 [Colletotrichum kahawae]|uniref:Uncharacterized protein n=1 Tax=Colletotrichum kahawae TaxID=34407 RepID=A0AAD9Y6C6_COLKA|nr:hypothetical protein CKAH01_01552 [Colletotrichum kahawae]
MSPNSSNGTLACEHLACPSQRHEPSASGLSGR